MSAEYRPSPPPSAPDFTGGHRDAFRVNQHDFFRQNTDTEALDLTSGPRERFIRFFDANPRAKPLLLKAYVFSQSPTLAGLYNQIPVEDRPLAYQYMNLHSLNGTSEDVAALYITSYADASAKRLIDSEQEQRVNFLVNTFSLHDKDFLDRYILTSGVLGTLPPLQLEKMLTLMMSRKNELFYEQVETVFKILDPIHEEASNSDTYYRELGTWVSRNPQFIADLTQNQTQRILNLDALKPKLTSTFIKDNVMHMIQMAGRYAGSETLLAFHKAFAAAQFDEQFRILNGSDILEIFNLSMDEKNTARDRLYQAMVTFSEWLVEDAEPNTPEAIIKLKRLVVGKYMLGNLIKQLHPDIILPESGTISIQPAKRVTVEVKPIEAQPVLRIAHEGKTVVLTGRKLPNMDDVPQEKKIYYFSPGEILKNPRNERASIFTDMLNFIGEPANADRAKDIIDFTVVRDENTERQRHVVSLIHAVAKAQLDRALTIEDIKNNADWNNISYAKEYTPIIRELWIYIVNSKIASYKNVEDVLKEKAAINLFSLILELAPIIEEVEAIGAD